MIVLEDLLRGAVERQCIRQGCVSIIQTILTDINGADKKNLKIRNLSVLNKLAAECRFCGKLNIYT